MKIFRLSHDDLTVDVVMPAAIRPEARTAAAPVPDPGSSRHGQNCHLGHHRLPAGEADRRLRPGLCPLQHRRRPAHREDPQDRPQGQLPPGSLITDTCRR